MQHLPLKELKKVPTNAESPENEKLQAAIKIRNVARALQIIELTPAAAAEALLCLADQLEGPAIHAPGVQMAVNMSNRLVAEFKKADHEPPQKGEGVYLEFVFAAAEKLVDVNRSVVVLRNGFKAEIGREMPVFLGTEPAMAGGHERQMAMVLLAHDSFVHDAPVAILSSGLTAARVDTIAKTWVRAQKGRKLKIKSDYIEMDATQMAEKDVLRIFELLQEKAAREKDL
jgi:hypothetical protein